MNKDRMLESAEIISENSVYLSFSSEDFDESLIKIFDKNNGILEIKKIIKNQKNLTIEIEEFNEVLFPFTVFYKNEKRHTRISYKYTDKLYYYNGDDLGATLLEDGSAKLKLWTPYAKDVKVALYDKNDETLLVSDEISMTKGSKGIWSLNLNENNSGIKNLNGYYYNYKVDIKGTGEYKTALDPYAKSMALWDNKKATIGKAAIVKTDTLGPKVDFAKIDGFKRREDAIIYEVHVRDLTVDPSIEEDLCGKFGTFKALIDKLPYIKSLGITHIQLLPVMSYFNVNESLNNEREMEYSSHNSNYNWGYDPHSYFSLSGMYSQDPTNPELRIVELKELIAAIHQNGMGITLDVVFNHTANVYIFEDLVPEYYHFMDREGNSKSSFGGGRLGTTHAMARKILVDSILYFTKEFKVDGFRFDMMGDHDAQSIQIAYDEAKKINPNIIIIGEGWRTFTGDDGEHHMPADQDWMQHTESVGVFSDEIRDELKSGYNSEGEPRFITGGKRNIGLIFDNIKAQPHNFVADQPGDVVQYIEAHDNLTLHDVIAQSIKKDPDIFKEEIHKRIRIGNALVLTSQGTAFLHAGQEYGRTKQWRDTYKKPVHKETYMTDENGNPFLFPYFIHDSYNSSDIINMFEWEKVTNKEKHSISIKTKDFTKGLIELRKSSDAFRLKTKELVDKNVQLLYPNRENEDLILSYKTKSTSGEEFYVFVNADNSEREFWISEDLTNSTVIVDGNQAGTETISNPVGILIGRERIILAPLTFIVIKK